ncbi:hypothetical protein HPB52_022868 [Rhipicephalus sanguineus]|uniref:Uncharacterized protein n=1 Tax=Rhipicephalus sanguineus TaxID=34632 RepID=A0A9D4TBU3_RHISA|nr:hypothetical protein HPB52_022868 [Rhipicephalus sanguineus]
MVVTPHLRKWSRSGHCSCDYRNEDDVFEILRAEYFTIEHVNSAASALVPRVGRGATAANQLPLRTGTAGKKRAS